MPFSKKKLFLSNWVKQFPLNETSLTNETCIVDMGKTKASGRTMFIDCLSKQPTLLRFKNLLSKTECDHLRKIAESHIKPSTVGATDVAEINTNRTSQSAFLTKSHDEVVITIENRIAELLKVRVKQLEPFQIVKYQPGQEYKQHHDWFADDSSDVTKEMGGNRLYTIFAYLNDLDPRDIKTKDGATCFPLADNGAGVCAEPIMGTGVFWKNKEHEKPTADTLHSGTPTNHSIKWGLNIWVKEFDAPW